MNINSSGRLSIVMGLPGSGKTTFAKHLVAKFGGIRMCPDEWMDSLDINLWDSEQRERIKQLQWETSQQLIALNNHVVIEWGTWARTERDILREGARKLGAAVVLYYLEEPINVLFERIVARGRENPPISLKDLESWMDIIEYPTAEELALFDKPGE